MRAAGRGVSFAGSGRRTARSSPRLHSNRDRDSQRPRAGLERRCDPPGVSRGAGPPAEQLGDARVPRPDQQGQVDRGGHPRRPDVALPQSRIVEGRLRPRAGGPDHPPGLPGHPPPRAGRRGTPALSGRDDRPWQDRAGGPEGPPAERRARRGEGEECGDGRAPGVRGHPGPPTGQPGPGEVPQLHGQ